MAVEERDPHSGYLTTGHEWNGIKELNTPVPKAVYAFLIATALFSVVYWLLMPAFPLGFTFTKGLLGADDREEVTRSVREAAVGRQTWTKAVEAEPYDAIRANPALMETVRQAGHTLFADNCAVCHGLDARGGKGFPNLTTSNWLWGGTPDAIAETIRVGINAAHPNTRVAQMLAFGRDGMLPRADIDRLTDYVLSLSGRTPEGTTPDRLAAGKETFIAQCVACHGEDGKGKLDVGAPDLSDQNWIYGGDPQSVYTTIWGGRQGYMPAWEGRLSALERKILTLYVLDLRRATP